MARETSVSRIGLVLDYIEENIEKPLSLDDISSSAGISKYHMNRVFKAMTDKPLMEYVRNRKLSRSVVDLFDTSRRIIDIAFEYGFAYEQSYIRSFRRAFGLSPDRFRRARPEVGITDKLDLSRLRPVGDDGMLLEPRILIRPAFLIVGESHEISVRADSLSHTANRLGNKFLFDRRPLVPDAVDSDVYIGFIEPVSGDADRVRYTPSVRVSGRVGPPAGMRLIDVPTRKCAVFKFIGFHHPRSVNVNEFRHVYEYAFGSWFKESSREPDFGFRFESIDNSIAREDYCEVELYIPIEDATWR